MTKRYRLTARAQMDGELRDPGYVFTLPDGVKGPHRTVSAQRGENIADHLGGFPKLVDEPLYRELSDDENAVIDQHEAAAIAAADAHAQSCAARDAEQAAPEGVATNAPGDEDVGGEGGDPNAKSSDQTGLDQ